MCTENWGDFENLVTLATFKFFVQSLAELHDHTQGNYRNSVIVFCKISSVMDYTKSHLIFKVTPAYGSKNLKQRLHIS